MDTSSGQPPAEDPDQKERWLIWRDPSDRPSAGRIKREDETGWWVDQAGQEAFVRERRGAQRVVGPEDLDLQELLAPGALTRRFDAEPVEVLADLVRHSPSPPSKEDLIGKLRTFGIQLDAEAWKKVQPKLSKHPHIVSEGRPSRYAWVDARISEEPFDELVSKVLNARLRPDTRDRALKDLEASFARGDLDPVTQAILSARTSTVPPPHWDDVQLRSLDDGRATAVLEAAGAAKAWPFLLDVALDPSASSRAREARDQLRLAQPDERRALVARSLAVLLDRLNATDVSTNELDWVARRVASLVNLTETHPDPHLTVPFLQVGIAAAMASSTSATQAAVQAMEGALANGVSAAGVASALEELAPSRVGLDGLRRAMSSLPFDPGGSRTRMMKTLATWHGSRAVIEAPEWWSGATLEDLGQLSQDHTLGPILGTPAVRSNVVGNAASRSLVHGPAGLAAVVTLPEELQPGVDRDAVDRALQALPSQHALAAVLARRVDEAVVAERALREAEQAQRRRAAEDAQEHARAELEETKHERDIAEAEVARLTEELGRSLRGAATASAGQLRQASLDGLTLAASVVADVDRSLEAVRSEEDQATSLRQRLVGALERAGIRVVGAVGERVDLDRSVFRILGDDDPGAREGVVVEPAYVLADDGVTVLRYGRVRLSPT